MAELYYRYDDRQLSVLFRDNDSEVYYKFNIFYNQVLKKGNKRIRITQRLIIDNFHFTLNYNIPSTFNYIKSGTIYSTVPKTIRF
jgi:hypothetical protein